MPLRRAMRRVLRAVPAAQHAVAAWHQQQQQWEGWGARSGGWRGEALPRAAAALLATAGSGPLLAHCGSDVDAEWEDVEYERQQQEGD